MNRFLIKVFSVTMVVLIMFFIVVLAVQNYRADFLTQITIPFFHSEPLTTRVAAIILLSYVLGGFTGTVYILKINAECDEAIDYYKRRIKKITQNTDSDGALIDSLQRKISSLEIALENALKDKNNG